MSYKIQDAKERLKLAEDMLRRGDLSPACIKSWEREIKICKQIIKECNK